MDDPGCKGAAKRPLTRARIKYIVINIPELRKAHRIGLYLKRKSTKEGNKKNLWEQRTHAPGNPSSFRLQGPKRFDQIYRREKERECERFVSLVSTGPAPGSRKWRGGERRTMSGLWFLVVFLLMGDIRRTGKLSYWVTHLIKAKQEKISKV